MNTFAAIDPPPFWPDPARPPRRVVVGMSGGVDSTFAAWALSRAGAEVIGIHFKMGDFGPADDGVPRCCSWEDARDARRMADLIGVPLYLVPAADVFRREVILPFARAYAAGLTPNPCIACNPAVKWRELIRKARELGADAVATGHHCRVMRDPGSDRTRLLRGRYEGKDQSYFLARLSADQLGWAVLPAGWYMKDTIRAALGEAGIPIAMKAESQDVSFTGPGGYAAAVEKYLGAAPPPGEIVDGRGRVLGRHPGIHHFTIGQRKGLDLPGPRPHYVIAIDAAKNRVVVGEDEDLMAGGAVAGELHWLHDPPGPDEPCAVKVRYKARPAPARVAVEGPRMRIRFERLERAITPGQAAVVYRGDEVLGGGIILREGRND
jgi:tRNA-specific 2-thiouridylase